MKRKSLILVLIALFCLFFVGVNKVSAAEETVTIKTSELGIENGVELGTITVEGVTLSGDKGSNTNSTPKYYNTGTALRVYGGNTLTISVSEGCLITSIVFTTGTGNVVNAESTVNPGELNIDGTTATITANANSLVFTQGGTSGHVRITTIVITYVVGESGGETPEPDTPVVPEQPNEFENVKKLFTEYYNYGVYTKETLININTENEQLEAELIQHFHAAKNSLDRVQTGKTTYYSGDILWFADGHGYGKSEDNKLTSIRVEDNDPTKVTVRSTTASLPGMEDYYCTLDDFVKGSHSSAHIQTEANPDRSLDLAAGWTYDSENDTYKNTTSDVIDAFILFTAPTWLDTDMGNYLSYDHVTVKVVGEQLVMKLWVSKTAMPVNGEGGKLIDGAEVVGDYAVFSQATISYELETNVSIEKAIEIANKAGSSYSSEKYTITGTITNVYDTSYGNMYIEDENGNKLTIYGTYSEDGSTRYDAMSYKPVVGDVVTLYGILGTYNSTPQMKNAWIVDVQVHECDWSDATCELPEVCSICNKTQGETLPHTDDDYDHVCDDCGANNVGNHEDTTGDSKCDYCDEIIDSNEPVYTTHSVDFGTLTANASYKTITTTSGWKATNCAVVQGGSSDNNPTFKCIGATSSEKGVILNGKTTAKGSLVSPTLSGTLQNISFSYANVFSESNGVDITVNVKVGGVIVATKKIDNNSVTKLTEYTVEWTLETPVEGDFVIEFVNNSPTNSTSNKDRVAIYKVTWTTVK